jgi:SAM-dependent methyltransferase
MAPADGERMLDIACGHGELLIRAATHAAIRGVGIDLSPWVIARSSGSAHRTALQGTLEWRLGDAHDLRNDEVFDVVACLGASWIWHGFEGTVRAMVARTRTGGRIAIGDLRLRDDVDAATVTGTYGRVLRVEEQAAMLERNGVTVTGRVDAADAAWDRYQERIAQSVRSWAEAHPGPEADRYVDEADRWRREHETDRQFLRWTVWTGVVTRPSPPPF